MPRLRTLVTIAVVGYLLYHNVPQARELIQTPVRMAEGVATSVELLNLKKVLMMERSLNGRYPEPGEELRRIILARYEDDQRPLYDTWGRPYHYRLVDGDVELRSFGPDLRDPGDDLTLVWEAK